MDAIFTIIGLVVAGIVGWFTIVPVIDKIRKDFLEIQPVVQIGRFYIISSGRQYSAVLKLHNLGRSTAYLGTVSLDGWTGRSEIPVIHPLRPGHNEYEVNLELGADSVIRTTKLNTPRLRIGYTDRWKYSYELSYPVVQNSRADGLFQILIQAEQPRLRRPVVSILKMRKLINETPVVQNPAK